MKPVQSIQGFRLVISSKSRWVSFSKWNLNRTWITEKIASLWSEQSQGCTSRDHRAAQVGDALDFQNSVNALS